MHLIERRTGDRFLVKVESVEEVDYKSITKAKFFFNWKKEQQHEVYKLILEDEIVGLMSIEHHHTESRIEIKLLAVSKENRGENKSYERIAGTLIAYACREALKYYGESACVSLIPKTELKEHYINQYLMSDAGWQVFIDIPEILTIISKYNC